MLDLENDFQKIVEKGHEKEYYLEWYNKIIEFSKKRELDKKKIDVYTEIHHVLPKCLGGTNDKNNLVLLTAKEHITAHILLHRAYENNSLLAHAANCMILLKNSKERTVEIEKLDINLLSELRELSGNLLKKSIVCFTKTVDEDSVETITVCKIYESISDTENDGFNKSSIQKAEKEEKLYGGYFWLKLETAEETMPQAIIEYKDKINFDNLIVDIYHEKRKQKPQKKEKIVCFKDDTIYRVYERLIDCSEDGFCIHNVSSVLNNKREEHLSYSWSYLSDFIESDTRKDLYEEFIKTNDKPELIFPNNKIICCDDKKNILRIYDKLSDITIEGFSKSQVCSLLTKKGSGSQYSGFYWYRYNDWKETEKLKNYEINLNNGNLPSLIGLSDRLISPNIIIKSDCAGNIVEMYRQLVNLKETKYSINSVRKVLNNEISSSSEINNREYKGFFWFRVTEFNKIFPGNIDNYLLYGNGKIIECLEKSEKTLNLILTVSSKLISVNELYKAKIVNSCGRSYPALYKNPKAVKVSTEIRNQLLAVDFSEYMNWLSDTKNYAITINFVLKSGITQRDCANFEKIMCDDLVKFIKNDLGISHFDDSEFLEVHLIKSIIPNAKNEYALIQLKESRHDIRFDHVDTPEKIFLAGPVFPINYDWKLEIVPHILTNNLTFYDPVSNLLDIDRRSIEKYKDCNVILYMFYPQIFEQMPDICSQIILDIDFILDYGNHSFLWVGILGEPETWGSNENQIKNIYDYISNAAKNCSRLKVKYINSPKDILS